MIKLWNELDLAERTQLLWYTIMSLFVGIMILYALAASRGQDVSYFKERLIAQEQRLNYIDQKLDKIIQKQAENQDQINELRRMQELQHRQIEEQQRWFDYWKTLPQIPKPPQKR